MSRHYKEKELDALNGKIESNIRQRGFFVRHLWKVIGFGLFVSIWAPTKGLNPHGFKQKSAIEASDFSYYELMAITAIGYTIICFLGHFIWKRQDKKALERLLKRKNELEQGLDMANKTSFSIKPSTSPDR